MLNKKLITIGMLGLLAVGMVGCGQKTEAPKDDVQQEQTQKDESNVAEKLDAQAIIDKITNDYKEKMPIGLPLTADDFDLAYPEANMKDLVEEGAGFIPMNVSATEVTIFKAKEGKVEEVKNALEQRKATQMQSFERYLQDQYEIIKESKVFVEGDYVYFISAEGDNFTGVEKIIKESLNVK